MKRIIIIGATSGIGYHLAKYMAAAGWQVGIVGRRLKQLQQLKATNPDRFIISCFDVVQTGNVAMMLSTLTEQLGGIDIIIYCSGAGELNPELDMATEFVSIDVNVLGFTAVADHAYNLFKAQGAGHFVAISSVAGFRGEALAPAYAASKAYQINYLEDLRMRSRAEKSGVRVTNIRPGSVNTDMMKGKGHFWITSPQQAAIQIYRIIKRGSSVAYVSPRWRLIAILLKVLPRYIYERMGHI